MPSPAGYGGHSAIFAEMNNLCIRVKFRRGTLLYVYLPHTLTFWTLFFLWCCALCISLNCQLDTLICCCSISCMHIVGFNGCFTLWYTCHFPIYFNCIQLLFLKHCCNSVVLLVAYRMTVTLWLNNTKCCFVHCLKHYGWNTLHALYLYKHFRL